MGASTIISLVVVLIIGFSVRSLVRDWRKKFAEDDAEKEARKKIQLERNKREARSGGVIDLKRGDDGVYRPGGKDQ